MDYFFVDFENVNVDGLEGLEGLGFTDAVFIFYSENANKISLHLYNKFSRCPAIVSCIKVSVGRKNALDMQLGSYLGFLIGNKNSIPINYYIVSNDSDFESLISLWGKKHNISLVSNIAKQILQLNKKTKDEKQEPESKEEKQKQQNDLEKKVNELINNKQEATTVAKIIKEAEKKTDINNALMKQFPSKNHKKASQIYNAIKPLLTELFD